MVKKILVILSENFEDKREEQNYYSVARIGISQKGNMRASVVFHNKKTDNKNELKSEIKKKPDVIIFHGCRQPTIKKTRSLIANTLKNDILLFSINSDHQNPEVTKKKSFLEIGESLK